MLGAGAVDGGLVGRAGSLTGERWEKLYFHIAVGSRPRDKKARRVVGCLGHSKVGT